MTYEEFLDDMDNIEISDALEASGIAGKTAIVNGEEVPLVEWIWEDINKSSFKMIKG